MMLFNNHKNCDSKQRFGIRKLSVGVCSVLLSTLFLATANTQLVHADKTDTDADNSNNSAANETQNSAVKSDDEQSKLNITTESKADASATSVKTNDDAETATQGKQTSADTDKTNEANTAAETAGNNTQKASEEDSSSDASSNAAKSEKKNSKVNAILTSFAVQQNNSDTTDSTAQSTDVVKSDPQTSTPKSEDNTSTTVSTSDLLTSAAGSTVGLTDSKVKTTNNTVDWSQNRYFYAWDQQGHTSDWWKNLIDQNYLSWILKQDNNEGATLDSVTWNSGMTTNSDGTLQPTMQEGPADNRFGYPHATVVVTNANGTKTTYTDVTINMAKSFASYIRAKWGISSNGDLSNSQSATTVNITTHAGAAGNLGATSVTKIRPNNWDYTGEYMQSLISSVDLASGTTLTTDTKNANVTLKFTDGSSIVAPNASVTVLGGQAQTGLTIGKGGNFAFAYPNATSGITSASQSQIAQWTPTYDWVYDANGTPLDATHQYNTNTNFNAYVKITYHKNGQDDGTQIVQVPINVNQQTIASTLGQEIISHIDHITSHPISAGTADGSTSSSWSKDEDPNGQPNLNQYTWGMTPAQIIWTSNTTPEKKAEYLEKIKYSITTSYHSFPISNDKFDNNTGSGYKVGPGSALIFTDGSYMDFNPKAWIYQPIQKTDPTVQNTFNTGDLSQFDSNSAASHVTNVLPYTDGNVSFDASYQWVVRDPNGTYTFQDALDMRNTNQWVTNINGQWTVANPSNSQGKQGVTIKGFRALTQDDIKDAGVKKFYVLIGYTKNGNSDSKPGTYDGYYVVPQEINVTLKGKVEVAKISGDGSQTVTYNGSEYNASNLILNKFKPTITDVNSNSPIPDKTLTPTTGNELTTADYEIKGNPTNVGSYEVYLKASGVKKIEKWTNADLYDWDGTETAVKVGTFTIKKATPAVTFNGTGSKDYDGQPLSDSDYTTAIGLDIKAPGVSDSTVSNLIAGTDYN